MHVVLLQQCHVKMVYLVSLSGLLLRCFWKFYNVLSSLLSHLSNGLINVNFMKWLKLTEFFCGFGSHIWQLTTTYFKEECFVLFGGVMPVDLHKQWVADVEGVWKDLRNSDAQWWRNCRCGATQSK